MHRSLQAQGLLYSSCWVVAVAKERGFSHTILTADGSTLADGNHYSSAEQAIAAGKQLIDQRNAPADQEAFRWIG